MELRLLGPIEVVFDGLVQEVGPPQQRLVLAVLAAEAGRPVSVESLIDRMWDKPPEQPRRTLQVYISRLRHLLKTWDVPEQPPVAVVRRSGGYLLDVDPVQVDVYRFQQLIDRTRARERDDESRAVLLGQALELWRGQPLADLPGPWAQRVRQSWRQRYLDAVVVWALACLHVGDAGAVLPRLSELVGQHPLVESLAAAYMRALYLAGSPAEALEHYAAFRRRLAQELGIEPGTELQQMHCRILSADPALAPLAAIAQPRSQLVPRQLPAPLHMFTGRIGELANLDQVQNESTAMIILIGGMAGVGKTALAVHWAHRIADRFPDGQLYVDLRGFASTRPLPAGEALRGLLEALHVSSHQIPATLDAQAALYRSLLSGRQVLVLLDNARDANQVRPLLPGSPGCLVVVTSRNQLTGLITAEGAHVLALDLLSTAEGRQFLAHRIGRTRVHAEPAAVDQIIASCAGLPLALAVVAARAASHPQFSLTALAEELRQHRARLDAFAVDIEVDVREVFTWSYHKLSRPAARLFRLVSLHAGPDVGVSAVAHIIAAPTIETRRLLDELCHAHVLVEPSPGRYGMHDLLRAYAAELAHKTDSIADRQDAIRRMLDYYLHNAFHAAQMYDLRGLVAPDPPGRDVVLDDITCYEEAARWFSTEHQVMLAIVNSVTVGFDAYTWQLAWTMVPFLARCGHWNDLVATQQVALRATQRSESRRCEPHARRLLGLAYLRRGRYREAHCQLRQALRAFEELQDHTGRAYTHLKLSITLQRLGHHSFALYHANQALWLHQLTNDELGQATALSAIGWYHTLLGNGLPALTRCPQALAIYEQHGDLHGQAITWNTLGGAHHRLDNHQQAAASYQKALDLHRQLGDAYHEAETLVNLGDTHEAAANATAARDAWRRALSILNQLGHSEAAKIHIRLDRLL